MKLTLKSPYLFFPNFEKELPNFTVITGKNGSGKTNLLKGIKSQTISNDITSNDSLITLLNNNSFNIAQESLSMNDPARHYDIYQMYKGKKTDFFLEQKGQKDFLRKTVNIIAKMSGKKIDELTEDDFMKYTPVNSANIRGGLYNLDFLWDCLEYANKLHTNSYNEFLNTKGRNVSFLTDEEFAETFGIAPWDSVNKMFDSMQVEYEIETSDVSDLDNFHVFFVHKKSREKMVFSSLSSGEQVIILTILSIFNFNSNFKIPKILLMDECDAWLHPSMIKDFLKVIEEVFVNQKNIKVILTTHNPTTVALSPEDSIYVMDRNQDVIKKTTKDAALKILTEGVPSFSVNYENRRQVFVESQNDVDYYERLYQIYNKELIDEISIAFISSGESRTNKNGTKISNCEQVINICDTLRGNGNRFIFGIIDFDSHNITNEYIKVLGEGNRYAIENYLLDPILLAIFMLIEGIIQPDELGLNTNENYISFQNFDNDRLQIIIDAVLNKIKKHCKVETEEMFSCDLVNGQVVNLPKWFLLYNGHQLEIAIKKAFPELNSYNKDGDKTLKLAILNKVIDIFPALASVDLIKILQNVQE
ncbi:AAA family ATPase [Chryseobacterium takakiae]|uniref:AAA domain-containing protein, putative AbiEii toxin, Type IV TA system n=1 Tax=Chryseobacterium takakiae TaxID=1302685 RepID=A0A1M4UYB0_9FLAO|nr:AAA family ATPase [Chryseobacterium takakiae]SHE61649.1 AAA domain-containing protein, putative AbiEii toxin, Type IV TA system [Chryseobacterium takakiae]